MDMRMKSSRIRVCLMALALSLTATAFAAESLPWEKDYTTALARAKAEKRPLFLMLTATWCGPCKMLESQTLPDSAIRAGLKEFVWVKAYEDGELNKKFGLSGYPTLVFIDPVTDRVLARQVGFEPPGSFLREVIVARKAAGLPLTSQMIKLQAKSFVPVEERVAAMVTKGDFAALTKYFAPARDDAMRQSNFLLARVHLPPGIKPADVVVLAFGNDQLVPDSGILVIGCRRYADNDNLTIIAPGCKVIAEPLRFESGTAVLAREFKVEPIAANEAAGFSGRVLRPDGKPASKAIVRVCDWATTRADDAGNFRFTTLSPGTFLVRAEYPGGEFQEELEFVPGVELDQDLPLTAVTTVGIRWALQRKEGSRELVGEDVRTGEAYFSVKHSRFLLERGAETRVYWGSDFMLSDDLKSMRAYMGKEQLAALEASQPGAPFFWLFDACQRKTGLHAEDAPFDQLTAVNAGKSYDEKTYFKFLRGEPVRKGQVYSLRGVRKDCYAKMEITDVTMVAAPKPKTE